MAWYFFFFFLSGFCSVLYELVWLRLAMAQFGVTTAMVSIVLSVFMAGLGIGSWASGRWLSAAEGPSRVSALRQYALIELVIGISGILVPHSLLVGRRVLEHSGMFSSSGYYFVAGLWIAATLLPWCALMGATVPVGMRALAQTLPVETRRSFSYLYMANVAGAVAGTTLPLFLIELIGFRGTLKIGAAGNGLIAISAFALSRGSRAQPSLQPAAPVTLATSGSGGASPLLLLFLSGLTCMAMEVVWVRAYTPYYGTVVYTFASILGVYLLATLVGSIVYRRWSSRWTDENPIVWTLLATCALFPLGAASPAIHITRQLRLLLGITTFTGLTGFITPMLVDRFSAGNPARAGTAYATNIAGCILGPLLAGFGLLPFMSERWALIVLTLPWLIVGLAPLRPGTNQGKAVRAAACILLVMASVMMVLGKGYEEIYSDRRILRDSTATVIATGSGMDKELLVNGYGMTSLTPITKVMAHLPLAFLDRPPQNAIVICFGMGTTFRSLHSWGIPVTAVELVPSVPRLFDYYHSDGRQVLESWLSHVVIDDGRRYLERATEQYDVITIDPPPPLQAAGSSLLYSEEFYQVAKRRLRPGGILQQWLPAEGEDSEVVSAIAHSVRNSFPYVRTFQNEFGYHFLCSERPILNRTAQDLVERMPAGALEDFAEWAEPSDHGANGAAYSQFDNLLRQELPIEQLVAESITTPALTDDRPINEYYLLRRWRHHRGHPAVKHVAQLSN